MAMIKADPRAASGGVGKGKASTNKTTTTWYGTGTSEAIGYAAAGAFGSTEPYSPPPKFNKGPMTQSEMDEWKTQHHVAILGPDPSAAGQAIRKAAEEAHAKGQLSDYDKREQKLLLNRQLNANKYNATWGAGRDLAGQQMAAAEALNARSIEGDQNKRHRYMRSKDDMGGKAGTMKPGFWRSTEENVGKKATSAAYRHKSALPGMGPSGFPTNPANEGLLGGDKPTGLFDANNQYLESINIIGSTKTVDLRSKGYY